MNSDKKIKLVSSQALSGIVLPARKIDVALRLIKPSRWDLSPGNLNCRCVAIPIISPKDIMATIYLEEIARHTGIPIHMLTGKARPTEQDQPKPPAS